MVALAWQQLPAHECIDAVLAAKLLGLNVFLCAAGHAYAAVISACAAGGAWQRAVQLFDQMLQYQIKPDVVSCTALITALGADGQWKRGSQVVDWMLRSGVKPNVRTYTALITAMGNAQKWDLALDLIKRMKTPQAWGSVEPNAYTYSALLKTMGEQVPVFTAPAAGQAGCVACHTFSSQHVQGMFVRGLSPYLLSSQYSSQLCVYMAARMVRSENVWLSA